MAWTQLGDYEKGLAAFLQGAQAANPSDILLLTIGQTYYQMKRTGDAVDYLLRTLNKTEDKAIEERARFLLGEIYLDTERAVQGRGAVRRDRRARPAVGRRALLPRGGVCEDEGPGEGAGGVARAPSSSIPRTTARSSAYYR